MNKVIRVTMSKIIWNLDTGLFIRRNNMILRKTFLGPLCYWAWRVLLISIITFCGVNLIFVIFVLTERKRCPVVSWQVTLT